MPTFKQAISTFATLLAFTVSGVTAPPVALADGTPAAGATQASPFATTGLFNDLPQSHWAYASIMRLVNLGLLDRAPALVHPEGPVTRAELLTWMLQMGGYAPTAECPPAIDLPCQAPYTPYFATAYRLYIVDGTPDGRFDPNKNLTREELYSLAIRTLAGRLAAMQLSADDTQTYLSAFTDSAEISRWARGDLAEAVALGLLAGEGNALARPRALTTRAEVAALLDRMFPAAKVRPTVKVDGRSISYQTGRPMLTTAYATGEPGVGTTAATGLQVRPGMIAVDPNVIPLGTLLYVEGYGYGFAGDTGGLIRGEHVDLYTQNYWLATEGYGMQTERVFVTTVPPGH